MRSLSAKVGGVDCTLHEPAGFRGLRACKLFAEVLGDAAVRLLSDGVVISDDGQPRRITALDLVGGNMDSGVLLGLVSVCVDSVARAPMASVEQLAAEVLAGASIGGTRVPSDPREAAKVIDALPLTGPAMIELIGRCAAEWLIPTSPAEVTSAATSAG